MKPSAIGSAASHPWNSSPAPASANSSTTNSIAVCPKRSETKCRSRSKIRPSMPVSSRVSGTDSSSADAAATVSSTNDTVIASWNVGRRPNSRRIRIIAAASSAASTSEPTIRYSGCAIMIDARALSKCSQPTISASPTTAYAVLSAVNRITRSVTWPCAAGPSRA